MLKRNIAKKYLIVFSAVLLTLACCSFANNFFHPPYGNPKASAVGEWGYVTPIADNNHPNLFWNQSEIHELRNMILVHQSPPVLVDAYNTVRNSIASGSDCQRDWFASLNYMIEPSQAKAEAIRSALLRYINDHPGGIGDWFDTGCFHSYPLALMFDLIQGYHPAVLSSVEHSKIKDWFSMSSNNQKVDSNDPRKITQSGLTWPKPPVMHQGKLVAGIPNWFTRYLAINFSAAMVGGNQENVTYWADSGWPHDLFTFDGVTSSWPPDDQNRYDIVTSLLAVYADGANIESYDREGYRDSDHTWYTKNYYSPQRKDGGSYHFAQMQGPILGAIIAYHNGMTGVFGITDVPGTEPALLRTFKKAVISRNEIDRRPDTLTGHPSIGYEPIIWVAHRYYDDAVIEAALSQLDNGGVASGAPFWDIPGPFAVFLGFPKSKRN